MDVASLQLAEDHQPFQPGAQVVKRPRTMAELMLDERTQLTERLVIFPDQKEGIIPESMRSLDGPDDSASASSLGFQTYVPFGISQSEVANERSPSLFVGNRGEFRE